MRQIFGTIRKAVVVTACAAAVMTSVSTGEAAAAGPGAPRLRFDKVATDASAAAQPTAVGRRITALTVFNGKVYTGYGDYDANTGPITVGSYDPSAGSFASEFQFDTEAVYNLRVVDGRLVAPATDPRVGADYATTSPWAQTDTLDATHVYDTASAAGATWLVGSSGDDAVAWRSLDHGVTWERSLVVRPRTSGDWSRFYFAAVRSGSLFVQAVDGNGGAQSSAFVFDGTAWTEAPSMVSGGQRGWRPVQLGDTTLMHATGHGWNAAILAYDGTQTRVVGYGYDVRVRDGYAYILGLDGKVTRSVDLVNWSRLGSGPRDARSLAVASDAVYVGTSSSELWRAPLGSAERTKPSR